ncbi:MAG TPA: hypothetical protein VI756_30265 [Blastocatellia bacterium]
MRQRLNPYRSAKASAARLSRAAAARRVHIQTQDHEFLGLEAGDILVWDDKAKPVAGDLILVELAKPGGRIRPAIFLAYWNADENRPSHNGTGENGIGENRSAENGGRERRFIEWTSLRGESFVDGKILGVVSHVIIPEVGIAALDLGLEGPDAAGPSFKILIGAVRLFGTMVKRQGFPCAESVAAPTVRA